MVAAELWLLLRSQFHLSSHRAVSKPGLLRFILFVTDSEFMAIGLERAAFKNWKIYNEKVHVERLGGGMGPN
jgi:hypothetical protein